MRSRGKNDKYACKKISLLPFYFYIPYFHLLVFTSIFASVTSAGPEDKVLVLEISEAITPASDDLIANAIQKAESENYEALIISLDTPGGGLEETQTIIKKLRIQVFLLSDMYLRAEKPGLQVL